MAEVDIKTSQWRLVEVGRVVLFTHGKFKDRLATIVEIIDHKRVCLGSSISRRHLAYEVLDSGRWACEGHQHGRIASRCSPWKCGFDPYRHRETTSRSWTWRSSKSVGKD